MKAKTPKKKMRQLLEVLYTQWPEHELTDALFDLYYQEFREHTPEIIANGIKHYIKTWSVPPTVSGLDESIYQDRKDKFEVARREQEEERIQQRREPVLTDDEKRQEIIRVAKANAKQKGFTW